MHNSRRIFIKNATTTFAGTMILRRLVELRYPAQDIVGVQLYSVRDAMTANPLITLKKIAEMGFKYVEHANYTTRKFYGYPAQDFRKILNDFDLKMLSGHTVMGPTHWDESKKDFTDLWKYTVDDAAIVGQQYVISPSLDDRYRKDKGSLLKFMEVFNKSGELCKQSGMKFGYHNHDFEFSEKMDGELLYDIILKNTDPELVIQQLDTGNLYNGGGNALEVVKKYPGRFLSLHVKDEIKSSNANERYESTILGKGIVDLKKVMDLVRKNTSGVHYIIEQEAYQGKDPLDCMNEDLSIMKEWGY